MKFVVIFLLVIPELGWSAGGRCGDALVNKVPLMAAQPSPNSPLSAKLRDAILKETRKLDEISLQLAAKKSERKPAQSLVTVQSFLTVRLRDLMDSDIELLSLKVDTARMNIIATQDTLLSVQKAEAISARLSQNPPLLFSAREDNSRLTTWLHGRLHELDPLLQSIAEAYTPQSQITAAARKDDVHLRQRMKSVIETLESDLTILTAANDEVAVAEVIGRMQAQELHAEALGVMGIPRERNLAAITEQNAKRVVLLARARSESPEETFRKISSIEKTIAVLTLQRFEAATDILQVATEVPLTSVDEVATRVADVYAALKRERPLQSDPVRLTMLITEVGLRGRIDSKTSVDLFFSLLSWRAFNNEELPELAAVRLMGPAIRTWSENLRSEKSLLKVAQIFAHAYFRLKALTNFEPNGLTGLGVTRLFPSVAPSLSENELVRVIQSKLDWLMSLRGISESVRDLSEDQAAQVASSVDDSHGSTQIIDMGLKLLGSEFTPHRFFHLARVLSDPNTSVLKVREFLANPDQSEIVPLVETIDEVSRPRVSVNGQLFLGFGGASTFVPQSSIDLMNLVSSDSANGHPPTDGFFRAQAKTNTEQKP